MIASVTRLAMILTTLASSTAIYAANNAWDGTVQPKSTGVIKKMDAVEHKITISHGPLQNLSMPAMTMVFHVEPTVQGDAKVGDSIRFDAEKVDGALTVVRLMRSAPGNQQSAGAIPTAISAVAIPTAVPTTVPSDTPSVTTSPVKYSNVFSSYLPAIEISDKPGATWRTANEEAGRTGGHAGQIDVTSEPAVTTSKPASPTKSMTEKEMKSMGSGK